MNFDADAFISYAHLDNSELIAGHKGWVDELHRALEIRVGELLGKQPAIWRDPELQGNDLFADTLMARLRRVAVLVSVVTPRYVLSDWARKELTEFWKAAERQGGIHVNERARLFKVLKTPVPLDRQPAELRSLLGYEFFTVDPKSGKVRELNEVYGPEAQRGFWTLLDDLARDMCGLLEMLEGSSLQIPEDPVAVYLADVTVDLKEEREAIKRDLLQHGFAVLPNTSTPLVAGDVEAAARMDLARCRLSIHLVGRNYAAVPEGASTSLTEIQNELAIERGQKGDLCRLVWIPAGLQVIDERQRRVVDQMRMDQRIQKGGDLLETSLEDLRTAIHSSLAQVEDTKTPAEAPRAPIAPDAGAPRLYLMYDQRDLDAVSPWADFLFEQNLEVIRPLLDGDEADIREDHEDNLRLCDGVAIFFGSANECWLRRKLREVQKSPGYGRTKPAPPVAICTMPPTTVEKERLRTHEAVIIPQIGGPSPDAWASFIARLMTSGARGR